MGEIPWYDLLFNLSFSFFGGLIKSVTSKKTKKCWSFFFASAIVGGFFRTINIYAMFQF